MKVTRMTATIAIEESGGFACVALAVDLLD